MDRRLLLFVIGLIVLVAVVLFLVAVWLPEFGVTRTGPLLRAGVPTLGRVFILAPERGAQPMFWLRPFGLHREGVTGIGWYLAALVSWLILAIMVIYLVPAQVSVVAEVVSADWGQRLLAFVIGALGYLGLGLLTFLIFLNVVGWPLLLVLSVAIYLATGLGLVAVSLVLGGAACRLARLEGRGPVFRLVVGVILLYLGSIIPYVGWVVAGCGAAVGFGAVLWTRAGSAAGWSLGDLDL